MFRRLTKFTLVFAIAFISACTCISTEVSNKTDRAVFVNIAYYDEGHLFEEEGVLLNPSSRFDIPTYSDGQFIRVRDLSGSTIAFEKASDDNDSTLEIMSLDLIVDAEPLGQLATAGNGPTRSFICGDAKDGVQLFGTTVTVTSEYSEPLVVSLLGDWQKPIEEETIRGALLPAGGSAEVYGMIAERGWLRADNQHGELVYTQLVPRLETSQVRIPSDPPDPPEPMPEKPFEC